MTAGPGKYDDVATIAMKTTKAHTVLVIVIGGSKGSGFSVQSIDQKMARLLPAFLRNIADQIEKDVS